MKLIAYFIIFGFIYYLISVFFPDAFQYLVLMAEKTYGFGEALISSIMAKMSAAGGAGASGYTIPFVG